MKGGGGGGGEEGEGREGGRGEADITTNTQAFLPVQCIIIMLWNNSPIL